MAFYIFRLSLRSLPLSSTSLLLSLLSSAAALMRFPFKRVQQMNIQCKTRTTADRISYFEYVLWFSQLRTIQTPLQPVTFAFIKSSTPLWQASSIEISVVFIRKMQSQLDSKHSSCASLYESRIGFFDWMSETETERQSHRDTTDPKWECCKWVEIKTDTDVGCVVRYN